MKQTSVAIIGSGRVGLPLALVFAQEGYRVFGVDTNLGLIAKLKSGQLPFREKGAAELLKTQLNKNFFPTTKSAVVANCQYAVLTLGTPVDENMNPSLVQIEAALKEIKPFL
jgi:UDP-N-acetyl-D-mannosaminuronic acid dehydrogenase